MPSVSAASHSGGSSPSRLPCSQPSEHLGGELKWVPRAFLPPCSSSGRNVLLLLGTAYLPGISFFGSFDFFSNCGSPALAACLGYFSPRGPPPPAGPGGERLVGNLPPSPGRRGWRAGGSRLQVSFVFLGGVSKSDGLMGFESQGGNLPGSIQVVSPLRLAL